MKVKKICILGTVGVPGNYGGFETLAENLVRYHSGRDDSCMLIVYCSSGSYPEKKTAYLSAELKYLPLNANGVQSIFYDIWSLLSAAWNRYDTILLLGVSGAVILPLIRLISPASIVTNIDGIEWRRQKWRGLAKRFLKFSERIAVRYSDEVIADNEGIADYVRRAYGAGCHIIAYGGDHAGDAELVSVAEYNIPEKYAFSVCRIEPENKVDVIVDAFARNGALPLVVVGNWENSEYGREIRRKYAEYGNLYLLDPLYHLGKLKTFRSHAYIYLHGHSAGGTNPSLVEAMSLGCPVLAFDCNFNRYTTEHKALYFKTGEELTSTLVSVDQPTLARVRADMLEVAERRYRWDVIAKSYFELLG
jgi:glycosyltransferase involved in cell wall biosynthesis